MRRLLLATLLALAAACGGDDDTGQTADNTPPEARLAATPDLANVGAQVAFSAAGSLDADGAIVGYRFVFADGSAAVETATPSATHVFASPGLYQVTLTVTDDGGATASATAAVNVAAP